MFVDGRAMHEVSRGAFNLSPGSHTIDIYNYGSVDPSGSHTLNVALQKEDLGPVDETLTYTLKATNCSGASEIRTATVHLTGSIESSEEVGKLER